MCSGSVRLVNFGQDLQDNFGKQDRILDRIYKINKMHNKEWIPACAGMTRLRLSGYAVAGTHQIAEV